MRNKETQQCLDSMGRKAGEKVGLLSCHGMGGNQVVMLGLHHKHRVDKYLDTLLANQSISDGEATNHCQKVRSQDCSS